METKSFKQNKADKVLELLDDTTDKLSQYKTSEVQQ